MAKPKLHLSQRPKSAPAGITSTTSTTSTTTSSHHPPRPQASNTAAGEVLLERLRILLNRLRETTDILQTWPESDGDSAKIHAETAASLIASIRKIVSSLRAVERHVNGTGPTNPDGSTNNHSGGGTIPKEALEAFRTSLDDKCPIPLDLLDLLDVGHPFGMNPQCYARGLMKEGLRQLAGLERRKRALKMLGDAIEKGLDERSGDGEKEGGSVKKDETKESKESGGLKTLNDAKESLFKRKRDSEIEYEDSKRLKTD